MPMNVSINIDDDDIGEETTRRVGGFTPSFDNVAFHGSPSMAAPAFRTPGPSINTAPQKSAGASAASTSRGAFSQPSTTSSASNNRVAKAGWRIVDVPILPEFRPLERSAVFVAHATAPEVARRVSNVLRERSIEATYDNAKAKARCVTQDQVEFRVFLYRGQKSYSHGIIVEVQRRFGSSTSFIQDARAILDAAEGKLPPPPRMSRAEIPLVSDSEDDYGEADVSETSLDFVRKMLSHPGYDARLLALQTLSSLSDANKMGRGTARGIAKALMNPDNDVGTKVFGLIVDKHHQDEEFSTIRALAMTVLANCVSSVQGNVPGLMREILRPTLIEQLRTAQKNPQMAFLACRCIEFLLPGDHNAGDLYGILEEARDVGESRHAGLMQQAQKCVELVQSR